MATKHTTKTEDVKAENRAAWLNLAPGKIEISLSPDLVRVLKTLHARGVLSDLYPPEVHITAYLSAFAYRREVDTRCNDAGRTTQLPSVSSVAWCSNSGKANP